MGKMKNKNLIQFGFSFERGGVHLARTMMLEDLSNLLSYVNDPQSEKKDYFQAIEEDNCLGKRSGRTRILTCRHLADLYALDPSILIFRTLLYFWHRDPEGHPLLALLCAYSRDRILRQSYPFIKELSEGQIVKREDLELFIENLEPGRFSPATLKSTAQNINSTWTKSGHFKGRVKKIRVKAVPTSGSVSYALLLGYLNGVRGESLLSTEYAKLLDCTEDKMIELAQDASRKGWITFKRVGTVIEVLFPNLLKNEEMELTRE
jgi:hypothetical protein